MAFPPVFTNIWDTTFPPDTQLANLLGQDLRQVRTDVMQRLSLLSGTLANRPTPEIVNATWGGAGFGLLYFSTDTNQVFQWSGAAWVDITISIGSGSGTKDYDDFSSVVFAGVAPATIHTVNIPIGGVQNAAVVGSYIEIESSFLFTSFTGPGCVYRLSVNGNTIFNFGPLSGGFSYYVRAVVAISSLLAPRVESYSFSNAAILGPQRTAALPGTYDGSVPVVISDAFATSTTVTATADFLHVRVRR